MQGPIILIGPFSFSSSPAQQLKVTDILVRLRTLFLHVLSDE
jgi:hypothetical protein